MKEYLLICSCHGQWKKAAEAFNLIFHNLPLPEIVKGRDRIFKLSQQYKNEHIKALSKLSGKFSYYVKIDEDGTIVSEYDLTRGTKLK